MIESLIIKTYPLKRAVLTCRAWRQKIENLVHLFLGIPDDRPEELPVKKALSAALEDLEVLDALSAPGNKAQPLRLPHITSYLKSCLAKLGFSSLE